MPFKKVEIGIYSYYKQSDESIFIALHKENV